MKNSLITALLFGSVSFAFAQTPVDLLEKRNLDYLETQEADGFTFRSQIVTEFKPDQAAQDVNLKLSTEYTYQLIVMGDNNIKKMDLAIKGHKDDKVEKVEANADQPATVIYKLTPGKSKKYRFTIQVKEFGSTGRGFVSFMVMRK